MAVAALALGGCENDAARGTTFHGVRLGMTPSDVRARFDDATGGSWTALTSELDYRLDWSAGGAATPGALRHAAFEFHDGLLVAVRADLPSSDPLARFPGVRATDISVVARTPEPASSGADVDYVMLARTCPTHKDEVARVLARGSK